MAKHPHPKEFYIVHQLHEPRTLLREPCWLPEPYWVTVTEGPADRAEAWAEFVRNVINPTLDDVYVLHVQPDVPARDVTEDWINLWNEEFGEDDDDVDHERQERHGWEQV